MTQLHHFCDASEIGYGAVSYLRFTNKDELVHCCFAMGKSRLVPIKFCTIPRLELSAAVLATRLETTLRQELDLEVQESFFWTDSTAVIKYIRNSTKRFKTFVANRLAMIQDGIVPEQWRYVGSKINPADIASRGASINDTEKLHRWWKGPDFLWSTEECWPEKVDSTQQIPGDDI